MAVGQIRGARSDQHDRTGEECPMCGQQASFEQPPCIDGHTEDGGNCPEWICTDCGTALLVDVLLPWPHRTG